jgi:glutathione peroxidase
MKLTIISINIITAIVRFFTSSAEIHNLNPDEFEEKLNIFGTEQLIDVSFPREFKENHIPGAININFRDSDFREQIAALALDKDKPVFLYCGHGVRSKLSASRIRKMGFTAIYDLDKGLHSWLEAGKPTNSSKNEEEKYETIKNMKLKKTLLLLLGIMFVGILQAQTTFHDFKVTDIDGEEFDLSSLKGKKILVVNVASRCGLTPQYEQLQALYEKYKDKNFVIIGFPANNFRGQEPGTNTEIKEFCTLNYNVTFPLMSKIDVIGEDKAPIYQWLTEKSKNGKMDAEVQWNFQKFMIDEAGNWVDFLPPREPFSERITQWIENSENNNLQE